MAGAAPGEEVLEEGWCEAHDANGKPYFYNESSGETSWIKPLAKGNALGAIDAKTGKRRKAGRKALDFQAPEDPGEVSNTKVGHYSLNRPAQPVAVDINSITDAEEAAWRAHVNALGGIDALQGKKRKAGKKRLDAYGNPIKGSVVEMANPMHGGGDDGDAAAKAAWLAARRRAARRGHLASVAGRDQRKKGKKRGKIRKEFGGGVVRGKSQSGGRERHSSSVCRRLLAWTKLYSEEQQAPYWYNAQTGVTTWNDPGKADTGKALVTLDHTSSRVTDISVL